MERLKLHNGSRIAIIGGGPAGTFFAHFASKLAAQQGLDIAITILDGKNFLRQGPPGCNMCAGVISETLLARLAAEGIRLPEGRVQRRIDSYSLQTRELELNLTHPQGRKGAISTVYRGSGPRFWPETTDISFDDFLLSHVKSKGVRVIEKVVRDIVLPTDVRKPVRLLCGSPESQSEFEADLVVGAFGLNTTILEKVAALGFGYRPPRFVRAFQAELPVAPEHVRAHIGKSIHVFSLGLERVRFAVCTPKSEHITVSIIGFDEVGRSDLRQLLALAPVRRLFPPGNVLATPYCCCRPRIALTPARHPFSDRFAIVGDASCSRYYKNGIESAFVTAQLAAEAAFNLGISQSAFKQGYMRKARRAVIRDNLYGRVVFQVHDILSRHRILAQTYSLIASADREGDPVPSLMRQVLWDMFTGNVPYRTTFFRALDLRLQARLIRTTVGLVVGRLRSLISDLFQRRTPGDQSEEWAGEP